MGWKLKNHNSSRPNYPIHLTNYSTILTFVAFLFTSLFLLIRFLNLSQEQQPFAGDLRDADFPWNKLCFGNSGSSEKLKIAVFSKSWPIGASPGGMERHAATLYTALAKKGHEIHVFTVPSDRRPHREIHGANLHVYFAANEHGSVNNSRAYEIFKSVDAVSPPFDYVHSESVSLPHWRAKAVPNLAVTWHGIWYEIMHSKLFEELFTNPNGGGEGGGEEIPLTAELQEAMPRLLDEIRFFRSYKQHICISNSAGEALVKVYQMDRRNVHVILNGVDDSQFVHDPKAGEVFRERYGIPGNATIVMGVAGRLVRDKGHPILYEALSSMLARHSRVCLVVAGSGPWGRRYAELGPNVKVLGPLEPSQLSQFYNAIDVFVNPTMRPQGLDLTLIEAMHCGKPVLTPNYPSIVGTVVVDQRYGYTFSPNVKSLVRALEEVIADGSRVLQRKGMACKSYVSSMFTAAKMASAYERFFLCMKNNRYCHYPLPTDHC